MLFINVAGKFDGYSYGQITESSCVDVWDVLSNTLFWTVTATAANSGTASLRQYLTIKNAVIGHSSHTFTFPLVKRITHP